MAVFPAINPIYSAGKQSNSGRTKLALGDGYESSIVFGLNIVTSEWNLAWLVQQDEADQIEGFLQARSDAGEWFEWQPPDSVVALRFRCDEWNVDLDNPMVYRISAVFRRVFELEFPTLNSVFAECSGEYLCEPDYGSINFADFWQSRITAPISDLDPQTYSVERFRDHKVIIDDNGYIYQVWLHEAPTFQTWAYCVITKRDIGGNIIWTKRSPLNIACQNVKNIFIEDIGDGYGQSLVVTCAVATTYSGAGYWLYENWLMTFSLNGAFRRAYTTAWTGAVGYLPITKRFVSVGGGVEIGSGNWYITDSSTGQYVAGYSVRQPGTIYASGDITTDTSFVEFSATKALLIDCIGANRIFTTTMNNYIPNATAQFLTLPYPFSGSCSSVTTLKYGDTALVFNYRNIYQYDQDGVLIRVLQLPTSYVMNGANGVKADQNNGNIYIQTGASVVTIDYELTTMKTITLLSPQGNNYDYKHGTIQGGGNMQNLSGNRYVISMDTLAGYGQSATGGRGIFMLAGSRLSKAGSYKTLNVGGFTASIQGIVIDQAITEIPVSNFTRYTVTMDIYPGSSYTPSSRYPIPFEDYTSLYTWNTYSTSFV